VIKNVLFPVITLVAIALPTLVTGAFITESIFSWPGVALLSQRHQGLRLPVIMAVLLLSSTMVILGNLVGDILYCLVDPRIKAMR
jgi:peptide/nickel transport system permease protein